jgi:hypothetical protein
MDEKFFRAPQLGGSTSGRGPAASATIERNIKSPALKGLYLRWRQLLLDGADLPGLRAFDFDNDELSPHGFVVTVEGGGFRYTFVGDALVKRLRRSPVGELVDGDPHELFGSLQATYRQCRTQQAPCYEFVRYGLGDERPFLFERLVMPFFGGDSVSHLAGVVLFGDHTPVH